MKMRTISKLVQVLCCLLTIITVLCGCWSRKELDTLAIALGIGFDRGTSANETLITIQFAQADKMNQASTPNKGDKSERAYSNISVSDINLFSAIREASHLMSRRLYFSHSQVLVFGESLANEDIRPYLDLFLRDQEGRLNVYIIVTKESALDILSVEPNIEKLPASELCSLVENQSATSHSVQTEIFDFLAASISDTTDPVAPVVSISEIHSDRPMLMLQEIAMFSEGRIAGYLNESESRGFCWLTNKIQSGAINCEVPGGLVSMEIVRSSSKITPIQQEDGSFTMRVDINLMTVINNQYTKEDLTTPGMLKLIEEKQNEVVREEMLEALDRAQEVKCDIFGFGEAVHKKYPKVWKEIMKDWDSIYPDIKLEINITSKIKDSGAILKPAYPPREVTLSGG